MPIEHSNTEERLVRIERMIEEYRAEQRRRVGAGDHPHAGRPAAADTLGAQS